MNRKGQLGQIITSFPVLFLLLIIMVLFFVIAGTISAIGLGAKEDVSEYGVEEINSRVLLEMFLGDYILIEGKKEKVEDVLKETEIRDFRGLIQEKFHEKYGCDKNNKLQIYESDVVIYGGGQGAAEQQIYFYVSYPETLDELKTRITNDFKEVLSEGARKKRLENNFIVVVKGNIKC